MGLLAAAPPLAATGPAASPLEGDVSDASPCPGGGSGQGTALDGAPYLVRSAGTSRLLPSSSAGPAPSRKAHKICDEYKARSAALALRIAHRRNNQMKPAPIGPSPGPTARDNLRLSQNRATKFTDSRAGFGLLASVAESEGCGLNQDLGLRSLFRAQKSSLFRPSPCADFLALPLSWSSLLPLPSAPTV